ncbi:MAG: hypothetical protein FWF23_05370, partial [Alphaproteobacteria bacterium]|nr:hypothetical protein [Alphaproteobacteria bacterium]
MDKEIKKGIIAMFGSTASILCGGAAAVLASEATAPIVEALRPINPMLAGVVNIAVPILMWAGIS